jgi:hypothetical protein
MTRIVSRMYMARLRGRRAVGAEQDVVDAEEVEAASGADVGAGQRVVGVETAEARQRSVREFASRASARSRSPSARSAVRSSPPTTSCRVRRHGLNSADQQVRRQRKRAAAGVPRHPLDLVSEGELRTNHTPRPTLTASRPDRAPGDAEEGGGNVRRAVTVIRPLRCELVAVRSSEASSEVNGRALSAGGGGRLLALLCFAAVPGS